MYLSTANTILSHHKKLMEWEQPFLFKTGNGIIDLSTAIGKGAHTPTAAHNQPTQYPCFRYSKHTTCYQFDRDTYFGIESREKLMKDIRSSMIGARIYNNRFEGRKGFLVQELNCSFHTIASQDIEYKKGTFMKAGTKYEQNKRLGKNVFPRMDNAKLKDKKRKNAVDHRSGRRVTLPGVKTPYLPRTNTHHCYSHSTQCNVVVNLLFSHVTNCWYLSTVGLLRHRFHAALDDEHQTVRVRDCDDADVDLMHVMHSVGTAPSEIGKIMDEVRKRKGQSGNFQTTTLAAAAIKHNNTLDYLKGIDKHWSTAKKVIAQMAA